MSSSTKSTTSTEKLSDVIATDADFNGVEIGNTPLDLLALYWALALYDEEYHGESA